MTEVLLNALVTIGTKYGKEKVDLLAKKLHEVDSVSDFPLVLSAMGSWMERNDLRNLGEACRKEEDADTKECAVVLRASCRAKGMNDEDSDVTLVWTGPSTPLASTRRTEQVLLETIRAAKRKLFIVSYVAYDIDSIVQALRSAIDEGVKVEILMESTGDYGGRISMDSIALFQRELPNATLYWWDESGASVHAKCAVADGEVAFVTSANLTGAAMERNMELGVKLEGGDFPKRLHDHLEALVTTKKILKVK